MKKEIVEVPVLSAAVRALGVPLSLVTRAKGMVFVSGMPPFDIKTGKLVHGDIEIQTEASLKALRHCLEAVISFSSIRLRSIAYRIVRTSRSRKNFPLTR